ncbi:MAG: hypothetical protein Sapg2KO_24670 [Saprospiraceae bacterium]
MTVKTEEELLKKVSIEKMMTLERFKRREPFDNERRYTAEWVLISNKIDRSFDLNKKGVELSLKWEEIKAEHKKDFITRFKAMHQNMENNRFK